MISKDKKFVFIHIPKCAGTSIELAYRLYFRRDTNFSNVINGFIQHATCEEIIFHKLMTQEEFNNAFKFSIVRNPWDRCVSEYRWRVLKYANFITDYRNIKKYGSDRKMTVNEIKEISFKDFMFNRYPAWEEISLEQHMKPQHKYIYDENMNLLVDYVAKVETLDKDFKYISDKIGIPKIELEHHNKTFNIKKYTEYYDDETKELVSNIYSKDIELFNYKFGD